MNKICRNSRISNNTDMKLGAETKLVKGNTKMFKKSDANFDFQFDFQFTTNLEQSESLTSDAWSIRLHFSLIKIFYLTKTENRTK